MRDGEVAVPHAILVAVIVAAASLGSVAFLSALPSPAGPVHYPAPLSTPISYTSESVQIPANGSGWGPLSNITFGGVQFRLWPEFESPWETYVQGTGTEPSGIDLAFVVLENNSSIGGSSPPTNESVRNWFSPDGVFGVTWLSASEHSIAVKLWVARPLPVYAEESLTLNSLTGFNETPNNATFRGVSFHLQLAGWGAPAGPILNASATAPNGTVEWLSMWDGPLIACALAGNTPPWVFGSENVTCLERGAPDHSVALLWDGYLGVTLMVRTA